MFNRKGMFMALKFRKKIRVFPGFSLNLSKTGMSATLGVRGCSVNIGNNGTYFNAGIPGTGIYDRINLNKKGKKTEGNNILDNVRNVNCFEIEIKSYEPELLTSDTMASLKQSILDARIVKKEMFKEWQNAKTSKNVALAVLILLHFIIIGFFLKKLKEKYKEKSIFEKELKSDYENFCLNINFVFDEELTEDFDKLKDSFSDMSHAVRIWDITSFRLTDKYKERTLASTALNRLPVKFNNKSLDFIKSSVEAMMLENANGGNLYVYPGFVIIKKDESNDFGIVDLKDIHFKFSDSRFMEEEWVPPDSENVGYTWKYCNKNGMPDKRFSNNSQIPIQKYGKLEISSSEGLNEVFMISNASITRYFCDNMNNFIKLLNQMNWNVKMTENKDGTAVKDI